MKKIHSYALTASDQHGGLFRSKLFVISLILALMAAFLPAASALAAPAASDSLDESSHRCISSARSRGRTTFAGGYEAAAP